MSGHTRQNRVKDECIREEAGITPTVKKDDRISP